MLIPDPRSIVKKEMEMDPDPQRRIQVLLIQKSVAKLPKI
jgi:hypothetical protein